MTPRTLCDVVCAHTFAHIVAHSLSLYHSNNTLPTQCCLPQMIHRVTKMKDISRLDLSPRLEDDTANQIHRVTSARSLQRGTNSTTTRRVEVYGDLLQETHERRTTTARGPRRGMEPHVIIPTRAQGPDTPRDSSVARSSTSEDIPTAFEEGDGGVSLPFNARNTDQIHDTRLEGSPSPPQSSVQARHQGDLLAVTFSNSSSQQTTSKQTLTPQVDNRSTNSMSLRAAIEVYVSSKMPRKHTIITEAHQPSPFATPEGNTAWRNAVFPNSQEMH